jgi:hypothetical protein
MGITPSGPVFWLESEAAAGYRRRRSLDYLLRYLLAALQGLLNALYGILHGCHGLLLLLSDELQLVVGL